MNRPVSPKSLASAVADEAGSIGTWIAGLVESALEGNQDAVRKAASKFAQDYSGDDRKEVRGRISSAVNSRRVPLDQVRSVERLPVDAKTRGALIEEQPWPTSPLLIEEFHQDVLDRFLSEAKNAERLSMAGLGSRFNLLLSGPPGTGKTFIAAHLASRLGLPFHVVRLDTVVSSLLGDTAKNIRAMFEFAAYGPGFLFLDEVDAIAKRRDDSRELGEIKRVVNTLLQGLDMLPERTVIVAATNHAHMLDPAVFRRFPFMLDLELPSRDLRTALWSLYLYADQASEEAALLGEVSGGLSCSDIRELSLAVRRAALIHELPLDVAGLAWATLESREGRLRMPPTRGLSVDEKKALQLALNDRFGLSFSRIGRLSGVSKQAAMSTVKRRDKQRDESVRVNDGGRTEGSA